MNYFLLSVDCFDVDLLSFVSELAELELELSPLSSSVSLENCIELKTPVPLNLSVAPSAY